MGFDNECIINMESLPGEYFCPVCRTLIYPTEALQAQCTHLYCKPCLAYTVATTQACPYDSYLVTQSDSKPLREVNKELADRIGLVLVHCLYYRSGCPWQGSLADCLVHGGPCAYGNSPVVCNRCGLQIVHRQVQDHAQVCPGAQQSQESEAVDQAQAAQSAVADPTHGAAVGVASQNEWYQQQQQQQYYDPYAQHASPYQPPPQQQAPAGMPPPNPYYAPVPAQQESDQETSRKGHNTPPAPYPGPTPHPYAHSPPAPYPPGAAPAGMIRSPSPSSYPPPYSAPPPPFYPPPPNRPPMDPFYPPPPYNNNNNNNNSNKNGTVLGGCWCRICKVECGTEQGLDVHSQSKDHQNKSMDIILGIKQNILIKRNNKIMSPGK